MIPSSFLFWGTICSLFALLGLGMEVVFTATRNLLFRRNKNGMGYSSLFYAPFYALIPVALSLLHPWLFTLHWFIRGLFYIVALFFAEYCSMGILRFLFGKSPSESEYRRSRLHIHGLIRLDYAPFWFLAGFLFEYVFLFITLPH